MVLLALAPQAWHCPKTICSATTFGTKENKWPIPTGTSTHLERGSRLTTSTEKLTIANPDDPAMGHVSVAGGTHTILLTGEQTGGRYCLIDMLVPPGGGPPPHRHDFEEMFTILEGEIEFTFRGET